MEDSLPGSLLQRISPPMLHALTAAAGAGLRIAVAAVGAYVVLRILRKFLGRLEVLLVTAGAPTEVVPGATRKRVATLIGLVHTLALMTVWSVAIVISLDQVGLDISPILAGAGILGLAVGFGAQNLVRDVISGFFVVLENQVRVGDVAVVNGTGGLVEAITFRTIVLRDLAGVVHVFPHGSVTSLSNMTKGWSAYVLDVGVAYREDTDRVMAVMEEVGRQLAADARYRSFILEPIEIFGVDAFGESDVTIKARLKTLPLQQWAVGREYRRRLKKAFEAEGIEIPFPQRSLHVAGLTKPLPVVLRDHWAGSPTPPRGAG